jgi:hypothetical protein
MRARARRSAHDAAIQDLALLHEVAPEAGWFVTTTISRGSSLVPQTSQFENSGNEFVGPLRGDLSRGTPHWTTQRRLINPLFLFGSTVCRKLPPTTCDALEASSSDGHYSSGLPESEPASIRWLNRRKALAMTSSVSSSHTHSCSGVANGSDLPGSKPNERMKPRDDCGTSAVSIFSVA